MSMSKLHVFFFFFWSTKPAKQTGEETFECTFRRYSLKYRYTESGTTYVAEENFLDMCMFFVFYFLFFPLLFWMETNHNVRACLILLTRILIVFLVRVGLLLTATSTCCDALRAPCSLGHRCGQCRNNPKRPSTKACHQPSTILSVLGSLHPVWQEERKTTRERQNEKEENKKN